MVVVPGLLGAAFSPLRAEPESFEKDLAGWQAVDGSATVSDAHWKLGAHSLRWDFKPGSKLIRADDDVLRKIAVTRDDGVKMWVYCETPLEGDLHVQIEQWTFPVHLGFAGWRAVWINLAADATKAPAIKGLQITAPAVAGTVFLDAVEFGPVLWSRQGDALTPYSNAATAGGHYWDTAQDVENIPPPPAPAEETAADRATLHELAERYDRWIFDRTDDPREPVQRRMKAVAECIADAHKAFEQLGLQRRGGIVVGPGQFAELDNLKPHLGYDLFRNIALGLAYDARLNNSERARQRFCDLLDYARDQGWASGSLLGTGYMARLRMMGYIQGVFMLRDYLRQQGRLARELETIRYQTLLNEIYRPPENPGLDADDLRTVLLDNYLAILMQDDGPAKVRDLECWTRWANSGLSIAPGYGDTLKPDGTVFHHGTAYVSAYGSDALLMGSIVFWLAHDTRFALSPQVGENLKRGLLALRFMGGKYEYPLGVSGRFPFGAPLLAVTAEGMAYMADALHDDELGAAFARLWDLKQPVVQQEFAECGQTGHRIFWYSSPGSLPFLLDASARWHAETDPQGHRSYPFAAMDFHRRHQWVASVKGWSKYLWNFEELGNQNRYGRYSSYGTLQIFGQGDPVNRTSSGYREAGWDWLRPPGATVIHISMESLAGQPKLQRSFTDDPFVGGVTSQARNGLWAMSFADPVYDQSFRFRKSVFFVDDTIVCCGSGITDADTKNPTETVLFQAALPSRPPTFPSEAAETVTTLLDPVGNGYFFPVPQKIELRSQHQVTKDSLDASAEGDFQVAWIDHGTAPHDAQYVYAIRPATTAAALADYAKAPDFETLQHRNEAHIVRFLKSGIVGYVLFAPADGLAFDALRGADRPCLVMTQRTGNQLVLSVADPDLRLPARTKKHFDYEPGAVSVFRLHMNGSWQLKEADGIKQIDNQTLEVTTRDGETREVTMTQSPGEKH